MEDGQQNEILVIIQARMSSSRLPGKILLPMPMHSMNTLVECIVVQLKKSKFPLSIFIATSINEENDVLEDVAKRSNVKLQRGSENDVLSRFIDVIKKNRCDVVVRLTADNPVLDISLLDEIIEKHLLLDFDYTASRGLPLGMNFEIMNSSSLLQLECLELTGDDREHVTLRLKRDNIFKCQYIDLTHLQLEMYRLTVDYPIDYLVVSNVLQIAQNKNMEIGVRLIKYVREKYPWLLEINKSIIQKKVYNDLAEEISIALPILQDFDFLRIIKLLKENR